MLAVANVPISTPEGFLTVTNDQARMAGAAAGTPRNASPIRTSH
jgi:hypothetical protein